MNTFFRGRRLRSSALIRDFVQETEIKAQNLIMPYFVVESETKSVRKAISAMPGQFQLSLDELEIQVKKAVDMGLKACLLFGLPSEKDHLGSSSRSAQGIVQKAIARLKKNHGNQLLVIADTCLCGYTSHGHCGLLSSSGEILNDESLELIAKTAVSQAEAGADIIAPSDMMDGRVLAIRNALDLASFVHTPIMSYSVKYASALYGPFREAAESAPKDGDRKSYQMNPANRGEAMLEAEADDLEGADFLMVKPAAFYLDIIRDLSNNFNKPIAAYQVSGEYSMLKAAAQMGWLNEEAIVYESLIAIKRAGASMIFSYFTEDLLAKKLIS